MPLPDPNHQLVKAAESNAINLMQPALDKGADIDAGVGPDGLNALQAAAKQRKVEAFEFLLQRGANPNATGSNSQHALTLATNPVDKHSSHQALRMFELAMAAGADLSSNRPALHRLAWQMIAVDFFERTHASSLKALMRQGIDPAWSTSEDGYTLLHRAAAFDNVPACVLLIQAGADIEAESPRGVRPLHLAALNGTAGAARVLLALGANTWTVSSLNSTIHDDLKRPRAECLVLAKNPELLSLALERQGDVPMSQLQQLLDLAKEKRATALTSVLRSWLARSEARTALEEAQMAGAAHP